MPMTHKGKSNTIAIALQLRRFAIMLLAPFGFTVHSAPLYRQHQQMGQFYAKGDEGDFGLWERLPTRERANRGWPGLVMLLFTPFRVRTH
jgi:hypothetical protein